MNCWIEEQRLIAYLQDLEVLEIWQKDDSAQMW